MSVLKRGSTGEIVRGLQDVVDAEQDGEFGAATERALKKWQKANGFKADGVAGPDLQHEIGLSALVTLEPGDRGELVTLLQENLGLDGDGAYGKSTAVAVKAWQKKNGLSATGTADPATLAAMRFFAPDDDNSGDDAAPAKRRAETPARAPATPSPAPAPAASLTGAKPTFRTWAYQLADIDPDVIAGLDVDLVVIDYSRDGDEATAFKPADLQRMKQRPAGGEKRVISYMSIGEAEDYRFYWRPEWKKKSQPAWLDDENPDWEGNYKVRYWDPDWKRIILGSATSYLDRIIAAGFDGVYLDIIDAFEYWRDVKKERAAADRDMIAFVGEIAAYARARSPGFLVVPQNGEALLADAGYRAVISAQAKEDLFYGLGGDGRANRKAEIAECMECLAPAAEASLPVLVVEYLDNAKKQADARKRLADLGFASYFAPRDLADIPTGQFGA